MAEKNIGKITQIISAVIDIIFAEGNLPEINSAINIKTISRSKGYTSYCIIPKMLSNLYNELAAVFGLYIDG